MKWFDSSISGPVIVVVSGFVAGFVVYALYTNAPIGFTDEGRTAAREVASALRLTAFDYLNRCGQNNSDWAEAWRHGLDACVRGAVQSDGEKICVDLLTPAQRRHFDEARLAQHHAVTLGEMKATEFEPGPCTVALGGFDDCLNSAAKRVVILGMLNRLDDKRFYKSLVEENFGKCGTRFWLRGISEYAGGTFCSYALNGFSYAGCAVVECGGMR